MPEKGAVGTRTAASCHAQRGKPIQAAASTARWQQRFRVPRPSPPTHLPSRGCAASSLPPPGCPPALQHPARRCRPPDWPPGGRGPAVRHTRQPGRPRKWDAAPTGSSVAAPSWRAPRHRPPLRLQSRRAAPPLPWQRWLLPRLLRCQLPACCRRVRKQRQAPPPSPPSCGEPAGGIARFQSLPYAGGKRDRPKRAAPEAYWRLRSVCPRPSHTAWAGAAHLQTRRRAGHNAQASAATRGARELTPLGADAGRAERLCKSVR